MHKTATSARIRASLGLLVAAVVFAGSASGAPMASGANPLPWAWPTAAPRVILRPFVAPPSRYSSGHRGIDISAGGEVLAPDDGVVHFVGFVVDRPVLSLSHDGGVLSSFEPIESTLARGDAVRRGQIIGRALAGHCVTACVHVGVRVGGEYVSPLLMLGGLTRAVLLPTRAIR